MYLQTSILRQQAIQSLTLPSMSCKHVYLLFVDETVQTVADSLISLYTVLAVFSVVAANH